MAIRTIEWAVDDRMRVTPTAVQDAGVQGDHNATTVIFRLPEELTDGYTLSMEYEDTNGEKDIADNPTVEGGAVSYPMPREWTQHGGEGTVRLVAERDGMTAYTLEGRVRFANHRKLTARIKSLFEKSLDAMLKEVRALYTYAQEALDKADRAADNVLVAEEAAKTAADAAVGAVEDAEAALDKATNIVVDFGEAVDAAEQLEALKAIIEVNEGRFISWWFGTREQYEEQQESLNNVLCFIVDDETYEKLKADVAALQAATEAQGEDIANLTERTAAIQAALPVEESGTWTPTLGTRSAWDNNPVVQPTYTTKSAEGYYHVIGDMVYVSCNAEFVLTDAGAGHATIGGLPFASKEISTFSLEDLGGAITPDAERLDEQSGAGVGGGYFVYENETSVNPISASGRHLRFFKVVGDSSRLYIGFSGVYIKQ